MSALTLARGTSSFTSGAAKFGADGLAGGVYYPAAGQDGVFRRGHNVHHRGLGRDHQQRQRPGLDRQP
jgi:hypothetical protein